MALPLPPPAYAIIPARGGSRGVPRKAEACVGGVPLLGRSIRAALQARSVDRVLVSTDDAAFAELAVAYGAEVPYLRPDALASDTASVRDVVIDLLQTLPEAGIPRPETLVLLQCTSPFTRAADIDAAAALLPGSDAVVSVCESEIQPDWLRRQSADGWLRPVAQLDAPQHTCRQKMPPVYRLNGAIYWVRRDALERERSFLPARTRPYCMPRQRSVDIDEPADLALARWMATQHPADPEEAHHVASCTAHR